MFFYDDFSKEIDDFFGFGRPRALRYNAAKTKDILPACWKEMKTEEGDRVGYCAICRTVGISPDDVKVEAKDFGFTVSGETEYEGEKYTQYFELPISSEIMSNIEELKYKTVNGLTYIYLYMKKKEKNSLKIEKI